ncbi:MAG: hypothetical protein MRERV_1c064 [Mycoplasmataceae bacterium RV_VA103A]|nr:MAG: hypothetical protein MRERV_1c064 [Mycoplasmataceae bacterium RV_VA103A]
MAKIIILIGKTGSGKSTLANVLSKTNKFKESGASVSGTREIQKEEFSEGDINYEVIDTVGIGDTKLKKEEVLDKIAEAVYLAREGVSQILFVTNGRFDQFEMATYNLLRTIIFDESITNHTTIVRTKFEEFEDEEECQADIEKMLAEKELCEIVGSCQKRIIHVNNSSLSSKYGKEERESSREIVLEHLQNLQKKCLGQEEIYKPQKLQFLSTKISDYVEQKIKKRKELEEKRKKLDLETKRVKKVKMIASPFNITNDSKNTLQTDMENNKKELTSQQEEEIITVESKIIGENFKGGDEKSFLKEKIVALRGEIKELEETKKLKEEIAEKEKAIRQEVLRHIFNNYSEITKVTGGSAFISNIVGDNIDLTKLLNNNFDELWSQLQELEKNSEDKEDLMVLTLKEIENVTEEREKELIELNKQLLNIREIFEAWQKQGFSIQQVNEWANVLGRNFSSENDALFCSWLRDAKQLIIEDLLSYDIKQLKKEHVDQLSWKKIHPDFTLELQQKWEERGFVKEQIKEWIEAGAKPESAEFITWFLNFKKLDMTWALENEEEFKELRDKYSSFGTCKKCQQPNTSENWCQPCAEKEWKQLTGQELVEKFIQQQQLKESKKKSWERNELKWIPYEQFTNIEYLSKGGFSEVYKAKWNDDDGREVLLKSFTNSQNLTLEFLTEIANTKLVDNSDNIAKIYGISQDPQTKNYITVMQYMEGGNLRQYLQQKSGKLTFRNRLDKLNNIIWGLRDIHQQNLVHRDLHSGNILNSNGRSYISDLGLGQPANYQKEGKIFGVLPYVAPEFLQGQPYTKAADIYSFGIIAYELFANSYPYPELDNLALKICLEGLRPNIDEVKIPQLLKDLIKRCWDADPEKRPSARELWSIIYGWQEEIRDKKNTQFYHQYLEIMDEYNHWSQNTPYQIHPTGSPIKTEEIAQLLEQEQLQAQVETLAGNNQIWLNNNFPKETKEIEIEYEDFEGQLVIEDYPNLEKIELREIVNIDKITLKNLLQLQECTIWDCGMKELIIENCPRIKKLNVRQNLLTSLEFLANLENLEELEIHGNSELVETLKLYEDKGGWKTYQKNIQNQSQIQISPK